MDRLLSWFNMIMKKRRELKRWQRVVTVLAAMITFATTYALILPAITVEKDTAAHVGGMYLEHEDDQEELLEENALEFTGVSIAADQNNAVTYEYSDDDMTATAVFSTDEELPEGAQLVVNYIDPESEGYAALGDRAMKLLDKEFIYDVTTCAFYDFALICDGVDVTPKTGLVDVQINFKNNTVKHVRDAVFAGRFGRTADKETGVVAMAAGDEAAMAVENEAAVSSGDAAAAQGTIEAVDTQPADNDFSGSDEQISMSDELVSANPDGSTTIELSDGIITVLSVKGNDLARTDSVVGILAGNVDEEAKAAAAETDAEVPFVDDSQDAAAETKSPDTDGEEVTNASAVKTLKAAGDDYRIVLTYDETSGIPEGATLTASEIAQDSKEYQTYLEEAKKAMGLTEEETLPHFAARFFDIKIMVGGEEFTPESGVSVEITYAEPLAENPETEVSAVHFADDTSEAEVIETNTSEVKADGAATVEFTAESFSVYGVVYTVDFHWEVNGKTYDFSLPGGGFVSLQQLLEVLGVAKDANLDDEGVQEDESVAAESVTTESNKTEEVNAKDTSSQSLYLEDVIISKETREFAAGVKKVEFSSPNLVWIGKVDKDTSVGALKEMNKLVVQYSGDLTEEMIEAINAQSVKADDWAIISLCPFVSEEILTITMEDGERFEIKVTDDQSDAIMKGQYVDTIQNPAGTTIDLFDYWIDDDRRNSSKRNGWPGSLYAVGEGNNSGINSSPDDTDHGHALKFNPAQGRTVIDGTLKENPWNDPWTKIADNGGTGLNSWTTNANPRQGIVTGELVNGYPRLSGRDDLGCTDESLSYLFDDTKHDGKATYFGVDHLLYVDPEGFYKFDSNDFDAHYNESTRNFELIKQDLVAHPNPGPDRGFWPFGDSADQIFWHGMHMSTKFSMPEDGKVLSPTGKYNNMIFEFQGDDDTWVYVDGILVGDGGGIHNQTYIEINFHDGTVTIDGKHDVKEAYRTDWEQNLYLEDLYKAAGKYNADDWVQVKDASGNPVYRTDEGHTDEPLMTFKPGTYHNFDMFYLERGGGESNLHIRYNLISTADFTAHKSYHSEANHRLLRDQFKFELIGLDGQYRGEQGERELVDASKPAIMPKGGSENGDDTVANPTKVHDDANNRTVYTVGVSEDGNVNFGDADISSEEMRNCDIGSPSTYRYMVREIVPPDAVNADGKTWASSTDDEKAEGGYHKIDENGEDITYDGKVYYFEGTVRRNELPEGGYKYDLKKTRYTDDTFTTVDTETKFFSFINGPVDPLALKVNKKSNTNKSLPGAEFKLTRAKMIDGKWTERAGANSQTKTSDAQGELIFDNPRLTEGHYLLKETIAPAGYLQSDNMWLVTVNKRDSETGIILEPTITLLDSEGAPVGEPEPFNVDNGTFTFEKSIINTPMPKGDITVVKKWLKPNGEEYTQEEMSKLDLSDTVITGTLCRRGIGVTQKQVKNPTVTIYGKRQGTNYSGKGDVLLATRPVVSGSSIQFWTYRDNANNISVAANNDSQVRLISRPENGDYNTVPAWRYIHEVSNIVQDTEITVTMDGRNTLRYGTVSAQFTDEYSTQETFGELNQDVTAFELSNGTWSKTWTREELGEGPEDTFTYYLKDVAEQNSNGFTFLKDETGILDPMTGTITFIQKNTNEKTKVKVKKVWKPMPDNASEASAKVALYRYRMLTKGLLEVTLVSDQGAAIEGAVFDLYKDGEAIGTYSTDVSGKITLKDLPEGEYYLVQKSTPSPYRIEGTVQTEPWPVSGDTFEKQEHKERLINYTQDPAGLFTIELQNPEGEGLENGIFDLYKQGEAEPVVSGISTDADGKWTTDRLGAGTYYFVQTAAPEGYVLPENRTTEPFTVNDPERVLEKTVTMINQHKAKGSVLVNLTKDTDHSPIAGAVFELYRNDTLLKSGTTDANGQVLFSDLTAGEYKVKQKSSASGLNTAESGIGSEFTIVENGMTNQDYEAFFTNSESTGNVTLNVYSARSGTQYNAYLVDTFTQLKANTTYRIRIGVPENNVKNGDQVSYCKSYEANKVPQGEETIDNSLWAYGDPAYAKNNNNEDVRMMYYNIEFTTGSDGTESSISIDSIKGWGLYPVTADTPQEVRRSFSATRNPLRAFSSMLRSAKNNATQGEGSAAGDVQPVVPAGYKKDTEFPRTDYTISAGDNWEHTFDNLDKYDENGNPYIYYAVEEDRIPQTYSVASYETNADGSEITVNNATSIELTLKKIDQDDMDTVKAEGSLDNVSLLDKAKFKLVKYSSITPTLVEDTDWNKTYSKDTGGSDGTFTIAGVVPGIYEIVETAYPKGYIHAVDTPYIQVMSDLTVRLIGKDGTQLNTAESYFVLSDKTIVVGNTKGAALPNTGGPGTRMLYLLGGILTLGAAFLLTRRKITT